MDDERAPVKASSKRGRLKKRCKEAIEKYMLARGLKRIVAQDHAMCRLGYKNLPTCTRRKTNWVLQRWKFIVNTPKTNGDDKLKLNTTNFKIKSIKDNVTI